MNIDQMTYNEKFDTNNFDDELKYRLANEEILREDLLDLLSDGFITAQQFVEYNEYCDYMEGSM